MFDDDTFTARSAAPALKNARDASPLRELHAQWIALEHQRWKCGELSDERDAEIAGQIEDVLDRLYEEPVESFEDIAVLLDVVFDHESQHIAYWIGDAESAGWLAFTVKVMKELMRLAPSFKFPGARMEILPEHWRPLFGNAEEPAYELTPRGAAAIGTMSVSALSAPAAAAPMPQTLLGMIERWHEIDGQYSQPPYQALGNAARKRVAHEQAALETLIALTASHDAADLLAKARYAARIVNENNDGLPNNDVDELVDSLLADVERILGSNPG